MAIPNSLDFSLSAGITRKTLQYSYQHSNKTKTPFPFISFLFLNSNPRAVKPDSSACSSPVLEDDAPIILGFQDFQPENNFPEDNKKLNALICSLFKDSQTENLGYEYYQKAKDQKPGFKPQRYTMKLIIRYLTRSKDWGSLFSFCEDVKNFQVLPDRVTCCRLISTCVKSRKFKLVNSFLDVFLDIDVETAVLAFDFAMKGYNQLHMYSSTNVLYQKMKSVGLDLNPGCYFHVMEACAGEIEVAEKLLQEAESKKMLRDPNLFLKLVLRYVEDGLMEKTLDVVLVMKRVNIKVSDCIFCAIVNGFSKKRGVRAAVQVYEDLVLQGCEPGQVTYASVMNMYFRLGLYSRAEMVFSEMEKKGYCNCVVAYSSMVAAYVKMGRTRDAIRLVAKMKQRGCEPNVWIYNSLLDMNGKALNLRLVEKTWKEMKRRKILPDRVSYTTVISAYNRAREFEMCEKYYEEFKLTGGRLIRRWRGLWLRFFQNESGR
ncbi:hypothetical protein DH2020_027813 [Rehmannia glutinosa]|uniref:Pentatricopeptide repeat-containing protein n=1 Tax=Rehmannia glutinosa TaxID=99300 RepID=A0ABR0VUY1_REHGL